MNSRLSSLFKFYALARTAIIIGIVLLLTTQFLLTITRVSGNSMVPTLQNGHIVVLDRWTSRWGTVSRGDIVSIRFPGDPEKVTYLKRVIGLPGETISIANGKIMVNNRELVESYLADSVTTNPTTKINTWKLGPTEYFMLGDNRSVSNDSRSFGPIDRRFFLGHARLVLWPVSKTGLIASVFY